MKKSLAILLVAIITLIALVSCGGDDPDHTHTFSEEWSSDATNHWHQSTCGHVDETSDFAKHSDLDGDSQCDICGYGEHNHTFSVAWISNETKHWKESTCDHDLKKDEADHVDANEDGRCDVCMYDGLHHHTFNTAVWLYDATGHWHPGTCAGHEDRKGDFAAHVTAENDGVCDVCGFDDMHIHTFSDTEWASDGENHWRPATCGHDSEKFGVEAHYSAANNGVCDTCQKSGLHIHEISDTEYESDAFGHWHKTTCGHDFVADFETHTEGENGACEACGKRLKYYVNVVVSQPDRVTYTGDTSMLVAIGSDVTIKVKVDSRYILALTTGGEIVGIPTTEAGVTTYTVKVSEIQDDVTLTLVAKYENAFDLSTLPATPDTIETTQTVYQLPDGSFSMTDKTGTKYEITYLSRATVTYDAAKLTYKTAKIATIVSIKDAEGNDTTVTWQGVTYGASGEGVTTVIPSRSWLGLERAFAASSSTVRFDATGVYAENPEALYVFESNVFVERAGNGTAFEIVLVNDGGGYGANTNIAQSGNSIQVMPMTVGSGYAAATDCGAAVGTTFNLRILVSAHATDASKMVVSIYINGNLHSSCDINKINNVRFEMFLRDDSADRNSTVTLSDVRFVKNTQHTHTFNTDEWVTDETGHWHAATCGCDVKADHAEHDSATNNGVCDVCGKEDIHVHTFGTSEYASNSEGHWLKANCGHDDFVFGLQPHVDDVEDGRCDVCGVKLKYTVNAVVTQPEKITVEGATSILANIGDDVTFTVKVNSRFVLYVTTGGGVIVGTPTTSAGITTYTVKVSDVTDDITLTLVAKLENAYDMATLPTAEATTTTRTVYLLPSGVFSVDDTTGTKYDITYVSGSEATYDAEAGVYRVEKVAKIISIKDADGNDTTLEWKGVTYGASGEGVATVIPTRNWLFEENDKRYFGVNHINVSFQSTTVNTDKPMPLYVFETDVLVEREGTTSGCAFELYLYYGNHNYIANTSVSQIGGSNAIGVSAINPGSGAGSTKTIANTLGSTFTLRIEVTEHATDATKMTVTLYINGDQHSTCDVAKTDNFKINTFLREDGANRNSAVTFTNAKFVKYNVHTHTFDTSEWVHDETGHWNNATCGHDVKGNFAEHDSATNNGVCDVCGEENIHVHTASDTDYSSNAQGHWHSANCGHSHYVADFEAHVDSDSDEICDVCFRTINCIVTVDFNTTYALLVTEGTIKGAPGTDVTFEVSTPATHTLAVVGAEIVGEPTENAGVKVYTVKVSAIADDTTVSVYTKRDGGYASNSAIVDVEPSTASVVVYENNGVFSTTDTTGTKYVVVFVKNTERVLDTATGTYTLNKVAKIVSIKNADNEETTITYGDKTYGSSGDGVVTIIPDRNWLGLERAFASSGSECGIFPIVDAESDVIYHFEADMTIEHSEVASPIVEISFHQTGTGAYQANMAFNYDPANGGKLKMFKFGKGAALGDGVVVDAYLGEVFNFAIDVVESAEAGSYDIIIYINGEAVATSTIAGFDADGRVKFTLRDDGTDRNSVITLSNVYITKNA